MACQTARSWFARPTWLKQLDVRREAAPAWFQSQLMVGGVCYVDLFAGTLNGLRDRLPYFKKLWTHLSAPDATVRVA